MAITQSRFVLALLIVASLMKPVPISAGWAGEEAAAIIAVLAPLLDKVVSGGTEIKNAMKFTELLSQYEDMENIQKKANNDLAVLKDSNKKQESDTNKILAELERFIKSPDDAYRLLYNSSYREKYLLSYLYKDAKGSDIPEVKRVIQKLYRGEDLTLNDVDKLYALYTLDEEEKLIKRLKDQGVDEDSIIRAVQRQRRLKSRREALAKKTYMRQDYTVLSGVMTKKRDELLSQIQTTTDAHEKALLSAELDKTNENLQKYRAASIIFDQEIEQELATIKSEQLDMLLEAYQSEVALAVEKKKEEEKRMLEQEYKASSEGADKKMGRFVAFVRRWL
jgi:hypothetical protein